MRFTRDSTRSPARVRGPHGPEHNLIQRPDLSTALARLLGMRQAHIAPTLQEGVMPVVILGDARDVTTIATDGLWCSGTLWTTTAPGSALFNLHSLWNPVASLFNLHVRCITVEGDGSHEYRIGNLVSTVPIGTLINSQELLEDRNRWALGQAPQGQLYQVNGGNGASVVGANFGRAVNASGLPMRWLPGAIVLGPGQGLAVQLDAADTTNLRTSWEWQEFARGT